MEVKVKFEKAVKQYKKEEFEESITTCGKTLEYVLVETYRKLKSDYEKEKNTKGLRELATHFEYLQGNQKIFRLEKITLGSLIRRFGKARIWKRISDLRDIQYYHIYSIEWNALRDIRNKAAHSHNEPPSKYQAEEMLNYTKIVLLETGSFGDYRPEEHILAPTELAEVKYKAFCEGIWCDEIITRREAKGLEELRLKLGLSQPTADKIGKEVVPKNIGQLIGIFKGILMDEMVFDYEENFFFEKARELNVDKDIAQQLFDEHKPIGHSSKENPVANALIRQSELASFLKGVACPLNMDKQVSYLHHNLKTT